MEQPSYVVVFPTVFAKNKIPQLISNIKKILKAKGQLYRTVKRDSDVILVDANDPVFASSAISLLFGIEKIAIARRVRNDFKEIVSEIALVGGNLLLKSERFLVSVEGAASGFLPKDAELAATSNIIEKKSGLGARPGTKHDHDKLLYCYLTRKNAYVCIYLDAGAGGVPFRADTHDIVCCVYDELSAVCCYETIKQGFNPKIIVCYNKRSELLNLAKAVNRILPRLLKEEVDIEVFRVKPGRPKAGYQALVRLAVEVQLSCAESAGISRVSVPVSSLVSAELADSLIGRVFEGGKVPILPLSGLDSGILSDARELGMERQIPKIERRLSGSLGSGDGFAAGLDSTMESRQLVRITVGPNNVHDFLDSLKNH